MFEYERLMERKKGKVFSYHNRLQMMALGMYFIYTGPAMTLPPNWRKIGHAGNGKSMKGQQLINISVFYMFVVVSTQCKCEDGWLKEGILANADIFNTSVCFTIPLFSFSFPLLINAETTCVAQNKDESCLPQQSSYTSIFKQNLLGQAVFFGVTAITVAASLAFPAFLKIQIENGTLHQMLDDNSTNLNEEQYTDER